MDGGETSQKGALSPTTITDYFKEKKSSGRKRGGKAVLKQDGAPPSVYLTPESSPGSHIDSEGSTKENLARNIVEHVSVHTASNVKSSGKALATEKVPSEECVASKVLNTAEENSIDDSKRSCSPAKSTIPATPTKSTIPSTPTKSSIPAAPTKSSIPASSKLDSPRSPKKCSRQDKGDVASHETLQGKLPSSPIFSVQTIESKTTSSSPCLPRLKIRKNARSEWQVGVTGVKEGETMKPKPGRRKKKEPEAGQKSVITDFFPVRRSGRQTKTEIQKEKLHQLEQMILSGCEDGLEIQEFSNKGRGVVATKDFQRGDFVVEYAGELIDLVTAKKREDKYGKNPEIGCYMYYFKCGSSQHCVDATAESGRLGRLLNHSSKGGNCCTRSLEVAGTPRLILVAKRDIASGEELTYDYGDRSKASMESHPWLKL